MAWTPPSASTCVAPALLMAYTVAGCSRPVLRLGGAAMMMFSTPAALNSDHLTNQRRVLRSRDQ